MAVSQCHYLIRGPGGGGGGGGARSPVDLTKAVTWLFLGVTLFLPFIAASTEGECMFPQEWSGQWFQGGRGNLGLVVVNRTHFSNSRCVQEGKASRYFVFFRDERCYKCVVIHMKHRNVIHYKESYCDPSTRDMMSACDTITGDNRLFWMFRWNAEIVHCPFKGPLTFTYAKGWEKECSNPVSQVDSCADDMRLLFRQQACPDVPNSQSKEEELVCLGTWKDGSDHYFAGKINHSHAFTDEDRYRCFMYMKSHHNPRRSDDPNAVGGTEEGESDPIWHLTMSNDAACQSLNSVTDAAKIMTLRKANHNNKKCKFPTWLTQHTHWHTLDFSKSYYLFHNTSMKISNGIAPPENIEERGHTDLRLICQKYESYHDPREKHKGRQKNHHNHADHVTIIVHFTVGCRSGYRCMRVYRRDKNVVQVQFGNDALNSKEACNNFYWEPPKADYITLVAQGENQGGSCGPYGRYHVPKPLNLTAICNPPNTKGSSFSHLTVGCSQHDTLELHEKCPNEEVDAYQCHGEWKSEGVTYVVASPMSRPSGAPRRVCFAYSQDEDPSGAGVLPHLVFTARHDTCISRRDDAHLTLNATLIGQCTKASGMASGADRANGRQVTSLMALFLTVFLFCGVHSSVLSSFHFEL